MIISYISDNHGTLSAVYIVIYLIISLINSTSGGSGGSYCDSNPKQSNLNSYLWKIKGKPPSYFFGTIHVPYTHVWDYIPSNAKLAFGKSQNIFLELDLSHHETATALAQCQLLPDNQTIKDILPRSLYKRLRRHMAYIKRQLREWIQPSISTGQHMLSDNYVEYQFRTMTGSWERLRPIWLMLTINTLTEREVRSFGVPVLDLYLSRQAVSLGKRTGAVENVMEQCEPLNRLNQSQVIQALNQTLITHEKSRKEGSVTTNELTQQYNCGDLRNVLFSPTSTPQMDILDGEASLAGGLSLDKYFKQEMLNKRNTVMSQRIVNLLTLYPDESFFFAFGAGHFLGNNSIVDQLRDVGFSVKHVSPTEELRRNRKKARSKSGSSYDRSEGDSVLLRHSSNGNDRHHRKGREKSSNPYPNFTKLWIKIEQSLVAQPGLEKSTQYQDVTEQPASRGSRLIDFREQPYIGLLTTFIVMSWLNYQKYF